MPTQFFQMMLVKMMLGDSFSLKHQGGASLLIIEFFVGGVQLFGPTVIENSRLTLSATNSSSIYEPVFRMGTTV